MSNPYEALGDRTSRRGGRGWMVLSGLLLVVVIILGVTLMRYRLLSQQLQEQTMQLRRNAEQAREQAEKALESLNSAD